MSSQARRNEQRCHRNYRGVIMMIMMMAAAALGSVVNVFCSQKWFWVSRGSLIKGPETRFVGWKRRYLIGFASVRKAAFGQAALAFVGAFHLKSFILDSVGLHLVTAYFQRFKDFFLPLKSRRFAHPVLQNFLSSSKCCPWCGTTRIAVTLVLISSFHFISCCKVRLDLP